MKKIILVEDDAAIRDVFTLALNPVEYGVTAYDTGTKILQNEAEVPDLFVLDKSISGTNGLDICRYTKNSERYKHVPVLILSASPEIDRIAKEAGADNAIAKPFSLDILRYMIENYTL